jgi:hypothetical protein
MIHVIIDSASRKILCFPHKGPTAQNAAEDFLKVFGQYAVCEQIHSDNGPAYISALIQELLSLLDVTHIKITPYQHQSNGQVEVFNREVIRHLQAIVLTRELRDRWSFHALPIVESIINNVPNSVTQITPNQYLHGNLFTAHRGLNTPFKGKRPMKEFLQQLWDIQPILIKASQAFQAAEADQRISKGIKKPLTRFAPDTYVVVSYPTRAPDKLTPKYRGPFLLKGPVTNGKKTSDSYIVEDLTTGKPLIFHADRIFEYFHAADSEGLTPLQVAARDRSEYVIDYISDHTGSHKSKRAMEFKVHWLGYEDDEATWEPFRHVKDTVAFERYCSDPSNGLTRLLV